MVKVTHKFINPIVDDPSFPGTKPSDWNDEHDITGVVSTPPDLGIFVGTTQPSNMVTYAQWLTNPSSGYWAWMQLTGQAGISGAAQIVAVNAVTGVNNLSSIATITSSCSASTVTIITAVASVTGLVSGARTATVAEVTASTAVQQITGLASNDSSVTITGDTVSTSTNAITGTGTAVVNDSVNITSVTASTGVNSVTGTGAGGGNIFYDTFTGTNGTAIASHTPDTGTWGSLTNFNGTYISGTPTATIQSNQLQLQVTHTGDTVHYSGVWLPSSTSFTAVGGRKVSITTLDGGAIDGGNSVNKQGIRCIKDESIFFSVYFMDDTDGGTNYLTLYVENAAGTQIASYVWAADLGTNVIEIDWVSATSINVKVKNGTGALTTLLSAITVPDLGSTATAGPLYAFSLANATYHLNFDNFTIK